MDSKEKLEEFIDRLMAEDRLQTPSDGFTQEVVDRTLAIYHTKIEYRPLLPKWMFYGFGILVVGLILFGFYLYTPNGNYVNYDLVLGKMHDWSAQLFLQFRLSKTVMYIIVIAGILACLQTILLRKHLNNRFA